MQAKRKECGVGALNSGLGALLLLLMPVVAFGQAASPFMTGATALQTNILILRCAGSEHGGTSQFASRLIGEREVLRTAISRSRRATEFLPAVTHAEHLSVESAVMSSEIEQLPDLAGYLKLASRKEWLRASLRPPSLERKAFPTGVSAGSARILPFDRAVSAGSASAAHERGAHAGERADDGFDAGG
jgi:hypothetical protein